MSGQIRAAMAAVMADVDAIGKNRRNEQQRYSFRGIDDFSNMLHPVLAKHGVVLCPRVQDVRYLDSYETKGGATMFRVSVTLDLGFVAADGSEHVVRTVGEGCDTGDKATNKAMSAALKYALLMTFLVPTEDRDLRDSEEEHHEVVRPKRREVDVLGRPDPAAPHDYAREAQAEARKALAARAAKLPGSPSRGLVIRDLANPHLSPDMFAEAAAWVAAQEAELAKLRRQGESLKRPTEPTAGAAPTSQPLKSPAILTSPAPMSLGAGGVGASTPEQDAAEVEAAVERAKERRAALAKQAAEGSMRAQLELAQQAGAVPPKEPIPDPGSQPARRRTQRGKAVTPEGVAEELAQAMDPTARLRQVTGDGEAW